MLRQDRVKLLVDALRSGEYKQGFKVLTKDDCDCPAGVACKVAILNGLEIVAKVLPADNLEKVVQYDGSVHCLPTSVRDWYGFSSRFIEVNLGNDKSYVTELNDKYGYRFDQIADLVEKTYLLECGD